MYLWSAYTSQVTRLCDLSPDGDSVTSVSWSERVSSHLSDYNFSVWVLQMVVKRMKYISFVFIIVKTIARVVM